MKSKLSPREIVQGLQVIEALTAEGLPVADALGSVGMRQVEYDGLRRTLGPLLCAAPKLVKKTRRTAPDHPRKQPN